MSKKSEEWFNENVKENREDIINIGELAKVALSDTIGLGCTPEQAMSVYGAIFNTIIELLQSRRDENDKFHINMANRLEIGYTSTDDDDAEKSGNFMIYMKHLAGVKSDEMLDEDEDETVVLATQWNSINITEQVDILNELGKLAVANVLDKVGIGIGHPEIISAIFCIIHEQIVAYATIKSSASEDFQVEYNICNLYDIRVKINEDGEQVVEYPQQIGGKLSLKSDAKATGSKEE